MAETKRVIVHLSIPKTLAGKLDAKRVQDGLTRAAYIRMVLLRALKGAA